MPNSQQHRDKAAHNREFLDLIATPRFPDWKVVVAFYVAVHLVERLRTRQPNAADQHSVDHHDRLRFVQVHHRQIHTAFHELFNAGLIARYQTMNSFNVQFPAAAVQEVLVDRYLVEIEQYVANWFRPPGGAAAANG